MSKKVSEVVVEGPEQSDVRRRWNRRRHVESYRPEHLDKSMIGLVRVRQVETAAFEAGGKSLLIGRFTAYLGSDGQGSLQIINGLYELNRNRSPVFVIACEVAITELGFKAIQEVGFQSVFREFLVLSERSQMPDQARRKTVMAWQTALPKRGCRGVDRPRRCLTRRGT